MTILTPDLGIVTAYARRARSFRSNKNAATSMFAYSEFVLYKRSEHTESFIIDEANVIRILYDVANGFEELSLANYFCELVSNVVGQGDDAAEQLRLTLNILYLLGKKKYPLGQLKGLYELRLMGLSGFMPRLLSCENCGCYEHERMVFFPQDGTLLCGDCAGMKTGGIVTGLGVTAAMRYCIYAEDSQMLSFSLKTEKAMNTFVNAAENFTIAQIERVLPTLEFYKRIAQFKNEFLPNE